VLKRCAAHAGVAGAAAPSRCRAAGVRSQREAAEVFASGAGTRRAGLNVSPASSRSQQATHAHCRAGVRAGGPRAHCVPPHRVCVCVAAGTCLLLHFSACAVDAECAQAQGDALDRRGTVRAFRSQLPRANAFYSFDPPAGVVVCLARVAPASVLLFTRLSRCASRGCGRCSR
jgi:hypothetical protein